MASRIPLVLMLLDKSTGGEVLSNLRRSASFQQIAIISDLAEVGALDGAEHCLMVPSLLDSYQDGACLCCGLNSALGDHLRRIFFQALSNKKNKLAGVIVLSEQADPDSIKFTLKHAPFLGQRYRYAGCLDIRFESAGAMQTQSAVGASYVKGVEDMLLDTVHYGSC